MSISKAYKSAFSFLKNHLSLLGALYLLLLIFALLIATPLHSYVDATIGNRLALNEFTKGFDYTFLQSFLLEHGGGISMLFEQAKWIILMFLCLTVYTTSGLVSVITEKNEKFDFADFFRGGTKYFWRYFRLSIYFLLFLGLVFYILLKIFELSLGGLSVFEIENDTLMNRMFYILLSVFLIIAFLSFLVHDVCKIDIAYNKDRWLLSSIKRSISLVFKRLITFGGFSLLLFIFFVLISWMFNISECFANDKGSIFLLFIFSQLYILVRIGIKIFNLAGLDHLYNKKLHEQSQV